MHPYFYNEIIIHRVVKTDAWIRSEMRFRFGLFWLNDGSLSLTNSMCGGSVGTQHDNTKYLHHIISNLLYLYNH